MTANIASWNGSAYVAKPVEVLKVLEIAGRKVFVHKADVDGDSEGFADETFKVTEWLSGGAIGIGGVSVEDAIERATRLINSRSESESDHIINGAIERWGRMNE